MADNPKPEVGKRTPPAFSFTTFQNFLDQFKSDTLPSHIDRSVMRGLSGGTQTYLTSALKYFGFVSEENVPEPIFHTYVKAPKEDRAALWNDLVKKKYGFLLDYVDIDRTTTNIVADKFRAQGINGDTVRKSITFFLHAAKAGEMKVSPHVKAPRPPQTHKTARAGASKREVNGENHENAKVKNPPPSSDQTPYEMLINILNARMTDEEQNAVWVLIRYLKQAELQGG